jgi:predicted transcriptional regulator
MDRVRHEWIKIKRLFHPRLSHRLSLVAIGKDEEDVWVEPDEGFLHRIAKVFQTARGDSNDAAPTIIKPHFKQNQLEVLKVLMCRWLLGEGAIPIGKLAEQVGCSQPTVRFALSRLERQNAIRRRLNRSIELSRFPLRSWNELLALSEKMRQSFSYRDASGERTDPERLLKRLERMRPSQVALGGVAAARHWHSDFDLHGTPRLDLLLHAPGDTVDLHFVRRLDPALTLIDRFDESPVLVVRLLQRADPLFVHVPGTGLPLADPVETALDLYNLGLTAQTSQLFAHFRPEIRLP